MPNVPSASRKRQSLPVRRAIATRTLATRARISLEGRSTDTAPQGLTPRVAKVRISIGRRTGKGCRFLDADGRFGPKVSCLRTTYVIARVAKPLRNVGWKYTLGTRLPRGRYLAWARGIDAAGNVEKKNQKRNLVRFTIR